MLYLFLHSISFEKRAEYAALVEKIRLSECQKQIEAMRRGLSQIIPEGLLNLLTWRELETMVCGKPILDVDLLKQNTVYRVKKIKNLLLIIEPLYMNKLY